MIDRQHGKIVYECDTCGNVLHTDESDFNEANTTRRDLGWLTTKVDSEWVHFCSEKCSRG